MGLEQRGRVRRLHERNNWKQEDLDACDKLPDGSRVRRELYARFCERLGVRLPGPTHPFRYYEDLPGRGWRYLNVSPSAKAPKKEREKLHEMTDRRQNGRPIPGTDGGAEPAPEGLEELLRLRLPARGLRKDQLVCS